MLKKTFIPYLFTVIFILSIIGSCSEENWLKVELSASGEFPIIRLSEKSFAIKNSISGGSIYFQTKTGKTWLRGKPEVLYRRSGQADLIWKLENREVLISFTPDSSGYHFIFNARPKDDITGWGFNIAAEPDEYFTGLFERVVDGDQKESWRTGITEAMNLRGQTVEMLIKPTLSLYTPFYLSSQGYGLFIEGTWPGLYDFCKSDDDIVSISFEGHELSGIIYTSEKPSEIVAAHSLHVGPSFVPPKWAFMPWRWRDNHTNRKTYFDGTPVHSPFNSVLTEDLLMMKALDIPCGVYWVDRPWAKGVHGYEDFEWDYQRFPEAENMIKWIHENDTRFLLWIAPWVAGEMHEEAKRLKYTQPIKAPYGGIDSLTAALLDFTNPEACKWWQEKGIEKMLKQGVDGFKLDRSEELPTESYEVLLSDGRTSREVRNQYPVLYVRTVNESCRKIRNDDFVLIPRAGYTGSSKYSGFWGGDIGVPAEGLRAAIIAQQRCAIIGFPVWGSDIGGYWQGKFDREVLARWLAFGCFSPIMEVGPTEDRAPWDMPEEPGYDSQLIAIWRMYAKIHELLVDYSYNLALEANKTGIPIVRPLFLVNPEKQEAWDDWQTFLYGPDILVSAIWEKGQTKHSVYLPEGTQWRDAWDKDRLYDGGQIIEVEVPLHKIPVFINANSTMDLGDLNKLYEESLTIASIKPDLELMESKEGWLKN